MKIGMLCVIFLILLLGAVPATGDNDRATADAAEQGFNEILDLWRAEEYEQLYARLEHPPNQGWAYFAERIVYGSRLPACCWEKLQQVTVRVLSADQAIVNARVGFEADGFGVRFVERDFPLHRKGGVWKLPQWLVLELANYNIQRIPRKIYERSLD